MEIKKRVQIAFDVTEDDKIDLKVRAAKKNISMNLWIMRAINKAKREEDKETKLKD